MSRRTTNANREEALGVLDRVRSLCDTIEQAYEDAHAYAFGPRDPDRERREVDPKHRPNITGLPHNPTSDIAVDQIVARAILRRASGRVVAFEQAGLRVLDKLSEMYPDPENWEPLESSIAFGPIDQDTTTQAWKEGDAQRKKRRIQNELARIETRKAKLQAELRQAKGA